MLGTAKGWLVRGKMVWRNLWTADVCWGRQLLHPRALVQPFAFHDPIVFSRDLEWGKLRQAAVFTLNSFRPKPAAHELSVWHRINESTMENELTHSGHSPMAHAWCAARDGDTSRTPPFSASCLPFSGIVLLGPCCGSSKQAFYSLTANEERKSFCQLQLASLEKHSGWPGWGHMPFPRLQLWPRDGEPLLVQQGQYAVSTLAWVCF